VTAQFKLSLLKCERSDPLADFFDARAAVISRDVAGETAFTVAGRDLQAFVTDASRLHVVTGASALLLGGWDAEKCLRLQITPAGFSGTSVVRVWIASDGSAADLPESRVETEFVVPADALSAFLKDIQHLVDRRELGDTTLTGDAEAHA
jgi:hypothetical protein